MSLIRTSDNRRNSVMPWQIYQGGSTNTTSSVFRQTNPALDGVDNVTIEYNLAADLQVKDGGIGASKLDPTGATEGQTFVFDGTEFVLVNVPTGSGSARKLAYWSAAGTMSYTNVTTQGGTLGFGTTYTSAEPTDYYIAMDVPTGVPSFGGLFINKQYSGNSIPAIKVTSGGTGGGALIDHTSHGATNLPALDIIQREGGGGARITHYGTSTPALDIDVQAYAGNAQGIRVLMDASQTATAVSVIHSGTGAAISASSGGLYVADFTATDTTTTTIALHVANDAVTTASLAYLEAIGTGRGLHVQRGNAAGAHPVAEFNNLGSDGEETLLVTSVATVAAAAITATGTGEAISASITNGASAAAAISTTTNGSGEAVDAIATGTGNAIHGSVTNADSTADALYMTHVGNGRVGHFARNVAGATAAGVTVQLSNETDAGAALLIAHAGSGTGLDIIVDTGRAILAEAIGTSPTIEGRSGAGTAVVGVAQTTGVGVGAYADTGSALYAESSAGLAIEAVGQTKTTTLRITGGSPDVGMVPVYTDTSGNLTPGYVRGDDYPCLVSLYWGNQTTTGPGRTIALPAANVPVQIPLDLTTTPLPAGYICNADWDTSTIWGAFTPTHNMDASGATTDGVTKLNVHFKGTTPAGWTACDVSLYVSKNGTTEEIDRRFVPAGGGGSTAFHLTGTYPDYFNGTDAYTIWASCNFGGVQAAITTWSLKVYTEFDHMATCADCGG